MKTRDLVLESTQLPLRNRTHKKRMELLIWGIYVRITHSENGHRSSSTIIQAAAISQVVDAVSVSVQHAETADGVTQGGA
jgi:hypothetical protein